MLKFEVASNYELMSQRAADFIVSELERRPSLLLCASAGSTPTGTYERLAARRERGPGLFKKLRVLQIDEWGGMPRDNPATCEADLQKKLVEPLHVTADRYIGFRSDAPDPEAECRRIAAWLATNGPIDICILGLGVNGHIAMNEPAAACVPGPHVAKLATSSRKHALLKGLPEKPRYGLTLGMGDILRSREVLLLVSGKRKRAALKRLSKPLVTPRFPVSFLWLHMAAKVLCELEAAKDIKDKRDKNIYG